MTGRLARQGRCITQLTTRDSASTHSAHFPHSPSATVLFGANGDSSDVGMVRVSVPAGAGMPAHKHGGSDVILTPVAGAVSVTKGDETLDVGVGDALLVLKEEAVALTNPHDATAELIVAAGPATFVSTIRSWPEVEPQAAAG